MSTNRNLVFFSSSKFASRYETGPGRFAQTRIQSKRTLHRKPAHISRVEPTSGPTHYHRRSSGHRCRVLHPASRSIVAPLVSRRLQCRRHYRFTEGCGADAAHARRHTSRSGPSRAPAQHAETNCMHAQAPWSTVPRPPVPDNARRVQAFSSTGATCRNELGAGASTRCRYNTIPCASRLPGAVLHRPSDSVSRPISAGVPSRIPPPFLPSRRHWIRFNVR